MKTTRARTLRRSIERKLRRMVLIVPLVAGVNCGGPGINNGPCPDRIVPFDQVVDGGLYADGGGFNCEGICGFGTSCGLADGGNAVDCPPLPCHTGRRPPGLRLKLGGARGSAVGAFFANAAQLEAAAVHAFRILAHELASHRAPAGLVRRALRAAADEVRHTTMTAKLAARYGAAVKAPIVSKPGAVRSLEEIALENAVEGCVRETYGAVVALWQSRAAADPVVKRAMVAIAKDETQHADLSWAIADWSQSRLSRAALTKISTARRSAVTSLRSEIRTPQHPACVTFAGVPTSSLSLQFTKVLNREIWAAA